MIFPGKVLRRGFSVSSNYHSGSLKDSNWYLSMRGTFNIQRMEGGNLLLSLDTEKSQTRKSPENKLQIDSVDGHGYTWIDNDDIVTFVSQIKTWADKQFTARELVVIEDARESGIKHARAFYAEEVEALEKKGYVFNTDKLP